HTLQRSRNKRLHFREFARRLPKQSVRVVELASPRRTKKELRKLLHRLRVTDRDVEARPGHDRQRERDDAPNLIVPHVPADPQEVSLLPELLVDVLRSLRDEKKNDVQLAHQRAKIKHLLSLRVLTRYRIVTRIPLQVRLVYHHENLRISSPSRHL